MSSIGTPTSGHQRNHTEQRRRRCSREEFYDHFLLAGLERPVFNTLQHSLTSTVDRVIQSVEAERLASKIVSDADILHLMTSQSPNHWNDLSGDLLDPSIPIPFEHRGLLMSNLPLLSNPLLSDYSMSHRSTPRPSRRQQSNMGKKNNYSDFDISTLKLDDPAPEVVSELPNGHGVTVVGTRLPNGEVTTRIKYDRQLMLALSHSPFSLAQPDNYPQIIHDMDEMIPVYPRRYIPREFLPEQATPSSSKESKSE